jgi:hypothetical protein
VKGEDRDWYKAWDSQVSVWCCICLLTKKILLCRHCQIKIWDLLVRGTTQSLVDVWSRHLYKAQNCLLPVWLSHLYEVWDSVCLLYDSAISVHKKGDLERYHLCWWQIKKCCYWRTLYFCYKVVDWRGDALLPYMATLQLVMDRMLHLTCREGYLSSGSILHHVLSSLASVTPVEYRCVPGSFNKPIKDYLPIKVWMLCPLQSYA